MLIFLTVLQAVIAALLIGVILMQKSEGGGLGTGGSPAGLMSARGAADFMTRLTAILATLFVVLSIVLAALATRSSSNRTIDQTLERTAPVQQQAPAAPLDPLGGAGTAQPGPAPAGALAPTAPATK
ncbi:preprotein translocase subunit SecG [Novosphingobium sp.]|uniref:preprotein translocase subunit SecG n=1 Tax=Novosphingobium sp. TaxID=1874826 RepID=UPI0025E21001|nr:preprotein translocase subunit SecG [Novosphingobium sp.]MCC6925575.1 preprotein translocase subunit SecG [Novosphingobium sp.]